VNIDSIIQCIISMLSINVSSVFVYIVKQY
jgi:hypothetical protein